MPSRRWYLVNDVNATYKGSVFLYDDADGQPMTMNSGGTNSALGCVMDVVPAAESEDDLVKQKLKKFKVNIQSILEVSANCMQEQVLLQIITNIAIQ